MNADHGHGSSQGHPGHAGGSVAEATAWWIPEAVGLALLVAVAAAYLAAARLQHQRGRGPWPRNRTVLWGAGLVCVGAAWTGPLAAAARTDFTAHMAGHLLLGMIGPLLLVLAAPVSLALRALPAAGARRLSRVLRSLPARVLTHPVVAAVLNAGGLWLLYTTELYRLMHTSPAWHLLIHAHVLLAGIAFTAAMVGPDPNPHRAGFRTRAAVLVLFIAAHSVLGKWLYGHPPAGVDPAAAQAGAQLMYYGGDAVDLALLVQLFLGWYPGSQRRSRLRPDIAVHRRCQPRVHCAGQDLQS